MTFKSNTGWSWNGEMWEPPAPRRPAASALATVRATLIAERSKTQVPALQQDTAEVSHPPGDMTNLSGFESLLTFGRPGPLAPVGKTATPSQPTTAEPPAIEVLPAPSLETMTEEDEAHQPVTLVGLGITPALGRSASVFDHLSYEGRDWTEYEIERVGKSEKRAWERRRRNAPAWPRLASALFFITGVLLMLGNLTGGFLTLQPLGFMVSAAGLLILHTKAKYPIQIKNLVAIVAMMLTVTVLGGTRSYAANQNPAPAAHELSR